MKQWKFNAGDSIRITNYEGKTENIEYSNIQAMIGNVYVIDNIDEIGGYYRINSELFKENELELADSTVDQPVVEKILIVNKVRPEYTTYIENTKDVVMKFFVGTRLFDFYVIKNGEMIELNSDKDVFALYETPVNNIKEKILDLRFTGDKIQIEDRVFRLGIDVVDCQTKTWIIQVGAGYEYGKSSIYLKPIYLKRKDESNAWYTLEEFADMLETGEYYFD